MKYHMLYRYGDGLGICFAYTTGLGFFIPLYLKLICFLKFKTQVGYPINKNCEGWKEEYIGKIVKVTPIKVFLFKHFDKPKKIEMINNYYQNNK